MAFWRTTADDPPGRLHAAVHDDDAGDFLARDETDLALVERRARATSVAGM
jgi:hypothetical protein